MGIFDFFVGNKNANGMAASGASGAVLSTVDARTKYENAFKAFERCYNDNWSAVGASRGRRENNITMIQAGIETFSHKADHAQVYHDTYKPVVDVVLNFHNLLRINQTLLLMDQSLKNPANTTLKRFDNKKSEIHPLIESEEKMGRMVASFLMYGNIFKQSIDTRLSKDAAGIFPLYVSVTIAEKEYYNSLCHAREKTLPSSRGSI